MSGGVYYNEIDPYACRWLQNLIDAGEIPAGKIDNRSIKDVKAKDLEGFDQCHFFAGIAGWPLALKLAGWHGPVWTGSCPCQPFSQAGKKKGTADKRHLWPAFFRLIEQCRPGIVFGEQVDSADGRAWLDGVYADCEGSGYSVRACVANAAGVGAPHQRHRIYWVAYASTPRRTEPRPGEGNDRYREDCDSHRRLRICESPSSGTVDRLANTERDGGRRDEQERGAEGRASDRRTDTGNEPSPLWRELTADKRWVQRGHSCLGSVSCGLGDTKSGGWGIIGDAALAGSGGHVDGSGGATAWDSFSIVHCRDQKYRRISAQSGDEPLAYGIPRNLGPEFAGVRGMATTARGNRVGRLRGYGNAIVPQLAAEFVRVVLKQLPAE